MFALRNKRTSLLSKGVLLRHDKARPHSAPATVEAMYS